MVNRPGTELAAYVRSRRLRAGLTQEALSQRAGLTVDTVSGLERGLRRRLYPHTARAIADALDLAGDERTGLMALAQGEAAGPPAPANSAGQGSPPGESATPLAGEPGQVARAQLPRPLTGLIGREAELSDVQSLLARARLLTLTGPGGIGKTRLAIAAAHAVAPRFADGVALVDLAPLREPSLALRAIAAALGVGDTPGRSLLATLVDAIESRRLLLVLDNCEHLLDAAPDIAALLGVCPQLSVLATSRAPLHIAGEQELLLSPLPVPPAAWRGDDMAASYPAVALFVERAMAVNPGFALTPANAGAVAAICARLDGLPLALELAAARTRLISPRSLLDRLHQRLPLLTGGPRDRPVRHQTLRAAIGWSYDLLTASEQALFQRLGLFAGGFTLTAVEAVYAGTEDSGIDLLDALSGLVHKSLVHHAADGASQPGHDGEPRFSMLETVREFAQEQFEQSGLGGRWRQQHFAHYLALSQAAEREMRETTPVATILTIRRRLEPEYANVRAALAAAIAGGRVEDALRLVGSLCVIWTPMGILRAARRWEDQPAGALPEARDWLARVLAMDGVASDAARAKALLALGRVLIFLWEDPKAERRAAIGAFEQSLTLFRRTGDAHGIAQCLQNLGSARWENEDLQDAGAAFEESLALCRRLDDRLGMGWSLLGLGRVANSLGEHAAALPRISDALDLLRNAGSKLGTAAALDGLGLARQGAGDYRGAFQCYEDSVTLRRAAGAQFGLPVALQRLAVALAATGELGRAAAMLHESLIIGRAMHNPWDIANALLALGALAGGLREHERGARLFGAGEALIAVKGLQVPEDYTAMYARSVMIARRALGDERFEAAHRAGAALPLENAIAEALALAPA